MNIINRYLLKTVLSPRSLYEKWGIDTARLKAILSVKLVMDDRRPNTFRQVQQKKQDKPVKSATLATMAMSAVLGLLFLFAFRVGSTYTTHLTTYFSMYIFMLASTLIADFTSVLIDVRDNYIILPKPVNDRTVVVARLLHIIIHVSKLMLPMTLPCIVYLAIKTNLWGSAIFLLFIVLNTLFTIFLVNALYLIILRITTPQKFQSVISYFQIGFAILMYGGYQLAVQAIDEAALQGYDVSGIRYIWLAPSYWFAEAWQGLYALSLPPRSLVALLLSLITPFASIYIVIKYFAPSFNQKLSQVAASSPEDRSTQKAGKTIIPKATYSKTLAGITTGKGAERTGFLFTWKMTARSKDFLMKVYPSFGYIIVYLVILFFNSRTVSLQSLLTNPVQGKVVILSVIYFSSLMLVMAINQVPFSERFKAAWIYFVTPVKTPGLLISGALKAVMLKYYIPFAFIISVPAIYFFGVIIIPNILLGISNLLLICCIMGYINEKHLPFSVNQSIANKSGSFIRGIFMLIIPAITGLIHYVLYNFTIVVSIAAILSMTAAWLVIEAIKNTGWQKVKDFSE
ncbi:MAG: hypothetical protein V4717_12315 [Bacteroidota bacterium]